MRALTMARVTVDAVIVVGFDPVVIHDADFFRILFTEPEWFESARESQHAVIVKVVGVDVPLGMRRQVIQLDGLAFTVTFVQIAKRQWIRARLVGGQVFAIRQIAFVIEIEVLASSQRAPGDESFHVEGVRRVGTSIRHDARPDGTVEQTSRLLRQIIEGHA